MEPWDKQEAQSRRVNDQGQQSGAITFDLNKGNYHIMELTGDVTGITIKNAPASLSWGVIIEATNWGNRSIVLGDIETPGGSLVPTETGTDKLVLSGNGPNASISVGERDIQ